MRWIVAVAVSILVACGERASEESTSPSPLIGADSDRLWILARSSRVGDGRECRDLYLSPDDPRFQGIEGKCDAWSRNYAEYLRLNGFATVEHSHLHDSAYWRWYLGMREAISDCREELGTLPVTADGAARARHAQQRNACDPYDDATKNNEQTTVDLGIRHP